MKTFERLLREVLNEHFQITKEEQELAEAQWDETIEAVKKAVKEWLAQKQQDFQTVLTQEQYQKMLIINDFLYELLAELNP